MVAMITPEPNWPSVLTARIFRYDSLLLAVCTMFHFSLRPVFL
jgi:hypothetical protein